MKIIDLLSDHNFKNKKVLEKLISYYLNIKKEDIFKNYDLQISDDKLNKIIAWYRQFVDKKKPLEYILGFVEFFWYKFFVDSRVLIPRPETEYIIQAVQDYWKNLKWKINILDVWTGCGVLGISSFLKLKDFLDINKVVLSDISEEALEVAKINVDKLIWFEYKSKFQFVKSDPYIPDKVFEENVEDNVKKREPSLAFLGGEDWLNLYKRMFNQLLMLSDSKLNNIIMFLEMMDWQVNKLSKEFPQFKFEKVKTFHFNIKIVKGGYIR